MFSIFLATGYGCEKNPEAATHFLIHSAKNGYLNAIKRVSKLMNEEKIEVNDDDYFLIQSKGVKLDLVDSYYGLGMCYLEGIGTDKDIDKAYEYFQKGAMKGCKYCQRQLGNAYSSGLHLDKNNELALYWWKQAAKQNEPNALVSLAIIYERGDYGEKVDLAKSLEYYQRAKQNGYQEDLSEDINRIKALIK